MAGFICPPDRLPQGLIMRVMTVAPIANPISAPRAMLLAKRCLTGESGCCSSVENEQMQNIYRLISPASMRYSGQCRRKLAATPKASLRDAASGVLSGPALFGASFTTSPLRNRLPMRRNCLTISAVSSGSPQRKSGRPSSPVVRVRTPLPPNSREAPISGEGVRRPTWAHKFGPPG